MSGREEHDVLASSLKCSQCPHTHRMNDNKFEDNTNTIDNSKTIFFVCVVVMLFECVYFICVCWLTRKSIRFKQGYKCKSHKTYRISIQHCAGGTAVCSLHSQSVKSMHFHECSVLLLRHFKSKLIIDTLICRTREVNRARRTHTHREKINNTITVLAIGSYSNATILNFVCINFHSKS